MRPGEILSNQPPEELVREVQRRLRTLESYSSFGAMLRQPEDHYENEISYTVLINKIPRGEAPEEVRKAWEEVVLPHCRRLKRGSKTFGLITGRLAEHQGDLIQVKTLDALNAMIESGTEKDYKAALWFLKQPTLQPTLLFYEDEVVVLEQKKLPKNRSYENPRSN